MTLGNSRKKSPKADWRDIFSASKIVVCMNPDDLYSPHLMIQHAQGEFLENFGYSSADLPLPFSKLIGPASIRSSLHHINMAILTRKAVCEFVNLYTLNGIALSCHLSVLSLTGGSSQLPQFEDTESKNSIRWAVITIRSASIVGNSKFSGIGLLGADRVSNDKRQMSDIGLAGTCYVSKKSKK